MTTQLTTRAEGSASDEAAVTADPSFVAAGCSEAMTIRTGSASDEAAVMADPAFVAAGCSEAMTIGADS